MKNVIKLIFLFLFIQSLNAQSFEIGGEAGYGKTTFDDKIRVSNLFGNSAGNNIICGLTCTLKPKITDLTFNTGLFYQRKGNSPVFEFFKIPLGINVEPGKKVKFLIGGGLYMSYLFMISGSPDPEINSSKYDFLLGLCLRSGIKYQITTQWNIYLQLQVDFDLTPTYRESIPNQLGGSNYQDIRAYDYTINFGFKYLLKRKIKK